MTLSPNATIAFIIIVALGLIVMSIPLITVITRTLINGLNGRAVLMDENRALLKRIVELEREVRELHERCAEFEELKHEVEHLREENFMLQMRVVRLTVQHELGAFGALSNEERNADIRSLQSQLNERKKTLRILETQAARYPVGEAPVQVQRQIEEEKDMIRKLERLLDVLLAD